MKRQMQSWIALPFLAFAAAGCQDDVPGGSSSGAAGSEAPPRLEAGKLDALLKKDVLFLDVRDPAELQELGTLKGYVNIPIGELERRLDEIPRDRAIITA